uniref:uncharacterized protein LOC122581155 n=1 Tax=Erigeron canadensis TaxID=72917 RepID=UPI001CB8E053|nr:uncharacterized protein LOC122581155 [Erigeron canadensis]
MQLGNQYRSVDREGTIKMLPRSNSILQQQDSKKISDDGSIMTTSSSSSSSYTTNINNKFEKKITRSNLVDQLREYQVRSKHDWASVSFFSSTSNFSHSSRVDVVVFVLWELVILAFFVFSAVSLYFRHLRLGFVLATITLLLLLSMKVTKRIKLNQKKKRRMLLPLSM